MLGSRVCCIKDYDGVAKWQIIFQESIRQLSIILNPLTTGWSQLSLD
jgi:hypothetical protein